MKKYIVLFLLCGFFGNAQYNLFARQNFANKTVSTITNTEIGGVASTISTPALLATKLGIDVSRITNFTIVGSDVKCKITGSYAMGLNSFENDSNTTYFDDIDGLVTNASYRSFRAIDIVSSTKLFRVLLKNATTIDTQSFQYRSNCIIYIPSATSLVSDPLLGTNGSIIYCNPYLATNNGGSPDSSIVSAISSGATVRYVTNFTAPNPVTTLAAGTVYNTVIQLNFTPPSSTNAIDYYECYANGILKNRITASGQYITGLTPSTSYNITLKAVDIFYNKSVVSNTITQSTTSSLTDADATAYTTASSNSAYQYAINDLFKVLKDNSLYTKLQAFYPFLGTTAAQHKWNAKNPLDTDAAFRLIFSGGGTHSDLGYQGNGTNSYANSKFIPSANQNVNSNGVTISIGTNNAVIPSDAWDIGAYINNSQTTLLTSKNQNSTFAVLAGFNSTTYASRTGINNAKGIVTGSKTASNIHKLIKNGSVLATSSGGGSLPNVPLYIGALNFQNTGVGNFSSQRFQLVLFHEGLSDVEVTKLHTIIDIFENALGRKTW